MGGLCVEGTELLLKTAVDSKGKAIGAKAVGSYGTPKCEFILQLVRVEEPETKQFGPCWCAAHPNIGEKLAHALIERGMVQELPSVVGLRREVAGVAGCDMRADFVAEHSDKSSTVVEVKTVLNTDYNPATAPSRKECVYLGPSSPYERAGIFPWGRVSQDGPKGEKVVSARAIKHIDELSAIARGIRRSKTTKLHSMMMFVVVRHDVKSMRINAESCPVFARHAQDAAKAGVRIAAHRVRWGVGKNLGKAFWEGPLKVRISIPTKDRVTVVATNKRSASTGPNPTQSSKSKKSK
jgi:DNA-binding sugar fermentation-stimulating protein